MPFLKNQSLVVLMTVVATLVVVYALWSLNNSRFAMRRGPANKMRRTDRNVLRGHQKKIYRQAQDMLAQGNVKAAAQLLESIGMTREAVSVLERKGFIDDAAMVLQRIGRPNRAGVIYSRHGMWKEAVICFKKANMPEEVAKCEREAGDYAAAAKYFLLANQKAQAAECFLDLGDHRRAAKLYLGLGDAEKALELYGHLMDSTPQVDQIDLEDSEVKLIYDHVVNGNFSTKLGDLLVARGMAVDAIVDLVKRGAVKTASEIYLRCTNDIGPELISRDGLGDKENLRIGDLFMIVSNYEYAGMIFERLEQFAQAGAAFEKAEDFGRALYCYERIGMKDKAVDMRCKIAELGSHGPGSKKPSPSKGAPPTQNPFVIADDDSGRLSPPLPMPIPSVVTGVADSPEQGAGANAFEMAEESTKVVKADDVAKMVQEKSQDDVNIKGPENSGRGIGAGDEDVPESSSVQSTYEGQQSQTEAAPLASHQRMALKQAEFLAGLSDWEIGLIEKSGDMQKFSPGDVILDYNDEPEGLYFILSGKVECYRLLPNGEDMRIDRMSSPSSFGEFWLLVDMPTRVKFVAIDAAVLHIVNRVKFTELLDQNGSIARKVYKRFTQKLLSKLLMRENTQQNQRAS